MNRSLKTFLPFTLLLFVCGAVFSHDEQLADLIGPYQGSGYSGSATTVAGSGISDPSGGVAFPRNNATLLSWITLPEFGPEHDNGNDCWGYTSPSGTEYAIMGLHAGTSFVDISDPGDPQIVATIDGPDSLWRDMKTYQEYCYAVSEGGGGIQVIDLTQIDSGTVSLVNTILTPGIAATHNVAIDEESGFLYRLGGAFRGMRCYDLATPSNPVFVGAHDVRYFHDAQIVTYTSGTYAGRQIAFCAAGTGSNGVGDPSVDILDVTDKQNIFLVKRGYYPNPQFSHQVWLSEDRQLLYVNDELDEDGTVPTTTHVFDVSDLDNAAYTTSFDNSNRAIGHNLYIKDGLIYEANYRSGVRVFETSNPLAPTEIAFFDSYVADNEPNFNGVWSIYPFFDSGVLVVSDIEMGLFVVWIGAPLLEFSYPAGAPTLFDPAGEDFTVHITEQAGGQIEAGTPTLHVDLGGGFVDLPMTDIGSGDFTASFPATICGDSLSWFVSARSTNGVRWKDLESAPVQSHTAVAANAIVLDLLDDAESSAGWTVGDPSDTATTGLWVNDNPIGTTAQPEDDHTPAPGVNCWVTGQGSVGGATGAADVDGGATTLLSPIYDLSAADMGRVSYWRWYSNDLFSNVDDSFLVDISDDAGASWVSLEILAPGDAQASGGWFEAVFNIGDFVSLTSQIQLRFIADDSGNGSWVEAAIDDFAVQAFDCTNPLVTEFCSGDGGDQMGCTNCPCSNNAPMGTVGGCLNSAGTSARLTASGDPSASLPNGSTLDLRFALSGVPANSFCVLTSGDSVAPGNMANPCFGQGSGLQSNLFDGLRCAVGMTRRHGGRAGDSNGEVGVTTNPWGGEGGPNAGIANVGSGFSTGQTRFFQVVHRENALLSCGTGLNTSQALGVTFAP